MITDDQILTKCADIEARVERIAKHTRIITSCLSYLISIGTDESDRDFAEAALNLLDNLTKDL